MLLQWAQQTLQGLLHLQVIYLLGYWVLPHPHMKRLQLIITKNSHLNKFSLPLGKG
jgi:hypothetical protein